MPGDGVKGKTWGPSSATAHVKQRPALPATAPTAAADTGRWAASSGPAQEMSPRNLVNVPTVGTVTEGETRTLHRTLIVRNKYIDIRYVLHMLLAGSAMLPDVAISQALDLVDTKS